VTLDVKIRVTDYSNNNFLRLAELRTGSGGYFLCLPSIGSKINFNSTLIQEDSENMIMECYIKITKQELSRIDGDRDAQRDFVLRNLHRNWAGHLLIVVKVLLLEGETLNETEMRYLVNLLSYPGNIMPVVPLLYRYSLTETGRVSIKRQIEPDLYMASTKLFLAILKSDSINQVALTSQYNISGSRIPELLTLYKDFATPIAIMDGAGRSCLDSFLQIKYLTGKGIPYNLKEKHDEHYLLYSFDSKPTRGKGDVTPAINVLQLDEGFSTFGPRHTNKMRPLPPLPPGEIRPPYVPRIFYSGQISYAKHNLSDPKMKFLDWLEAKGISQDRDYDSLVKRYYKDYETANIFNVVKDLSNVAREGTIDPLLSSTNEVSREVRKIKRNNSIILTGTL
jgi:hypothetical protein